MKHANAVRNVCLSVSIDTWFTIHNQTEGGSATKGEEEMNGCDGEERLNFLLFYHFVQFHLIFMILRLSLLPSFSLFHFRGPFLWSLASHIIKNKTRRRVSMRMEKRVKRLREHVHFSPLSFAGCINHLSMFHCLVKTLYKHKYNWREWRVQVQHVSSINSPYLSSNEEAMSYKYVVLSALKVAKQHLWSNQSRRMQLKREVMRKLELKNRAGNEDEREKEVPTRTKQTA